MAIPGEKDASYSVARDARGEHRRPGRGCKQVANGGGHAVRAQEAAYRVAAAYEPRVETVPRGEPTRTLVVYFNGTFVHRLNGAHARVWEQLAWACGRFRRVVLFSFSDHPDCPWGDREVAIFRRSFPDVELVLEPRSRRLRALTRLKNAALALAPDAVEVIARLRIDGASPAYDRLVRDEQPVFLVNYVDAFTELNGVDPALCVIETHDLKFLHFAKKRSKSVADLRVIGKFRSEMALLERAGAIIAIAPPEHGLFRLLYDNDNIFYVPKYQGAPQPSDPGTKPEYDLVFVGSDNHFNVLGLAEFLRGAAWAAAYRIAVAGQVCQAHLVQRVCANMPNVDLLGFVDDIAGLYARSKVAISPVDGTGLKIKVVEALAAGKPVLGSAHTLAGLPAGWNTCAFPLAASQAERLLSDDALLARASRSAIEYAATIQNAGDLPRLERFLDERLRVRCDEGAAEAVPPKSGDDG
jgi:glycosyltransferase involved in cell wall biosynthesis